MARHAATYCWIHLVWGTKRRAPIEDRAARVRISRFLKQQADLKEVPMLANYVNADHVHALINLPSNQSLADAVQMLKGASSHWITKQGVIPGTFSWACGYGAFSVSPLQVDRVAQYIAHQEVHHHQAGFDAEYRTMINTAQASRPKKLR